MPRRTAPAAPPPRPADPRAALVPFPQLWPARVPLGRPLGPPVAVEAVSCGPYHTAAVTGDGVLYTWGDGLFGKLGHGSHDGAPAPRAVEGLRGCWVVGASCGWWVAGGAKALG